MLLTCRSDTRQPVESVMALFSGGARHIMPGLSGYEGLSSMALVSITEAARLVRRGRATLYRDIDKGRLSKTVLPDGGTAIETSELIRTYGNLHNDPSAEQDMSADELKMQMQMMEERIRHLERIIALEADLRRVKDEVTNELRARLADKDSVIQTLESKVVLLLEYKKPADTRAQDRPTEPRPGFWNRLRGKNSGDGK
jgi:hypothetical protein